MTRELMQGADLVLAEVSAPSTGQGIELGIAHALEVPIICIYEKGSVPSRALGYITDKFIEYADPSDMLEKLEIELGSFKK